MLATRTSHAPRFSGAYAPCVAAILCLLLVVGPAAVFGAVRPVGIDTIDRCASERRITHVFVKLHWVSPSFTYRDTTSAINRVACILGVEASLYHLVPATVDRFSRQTVSPIGFFYQTSAAARGPVFAVLSLFIAIEAVSGDEDFFSAVASAAPESCPITDSHGLNDGQLSAALSTPVFDALRVFDRLKLHGSYSDCESCWPSGVSPPRGLIVSSRLARVN